MRDSLWLVAEGDNPFDAIKELAESHRRVKLGRGVVGKTSYLTFALFVLWGIIFWRLSENLVFDALLLGGGLVVTGVYFWWVRSTQHFATKNPSLALLEGAEFLEYQKWEAEIRGQPKPTLPLIPNPDAPPQLPDKS